MPVASDQLDALLRGPTPILALAPMQEVTDGEFWTLVHRYGGADVYWTEYFRVHSTSTPEKKIVDAITRNTTGRPVVAQMIGNDIQELVRTAKFLQQLPVGAIDLNRTNVAPIGSLVPTVNVLALPFLFRSAEHLHKVLDGPIGDEILASFEGFGFIGLTFYDSGARSLYNSVRPVRSLADMKGLRIRVQQSPRITRGQVVRHR